MFCQVPPDGEASGVPSQTYVGLVFSTPFSSLTSGVFVPVLSAQRAIAVLELFGQARERRDQDLLDALSSIGSQFAQFMERRRAEARLLERTLAAERAAEALRVSELRFRRLSESNMFGVLVGDTSGHLLEGNDELLRMTGYSRADLEAGLVRWDHMTPPEHAEAVRAFNSALDRRGASGTAGRGDGHHRWRAVQGEKGRAGDDRRLHRLSVTLLQPVRP